MAVWDESEWEAMHELIHKESSWNHLAQNKSSQACGLFQSWPCAKVLLVAKDLHNIEGQADWGVAYIQNRYGSPSKALSFWKYQAPKYDFDKDGKADGYHWY